MDYEFVAGIAASIYVGLNLGVGIKSFSFLRDNPISELENKMQGAEGFDAVLDVLSRPGRYVASRIYQRLNN